MAAFPVEQNQHLFRGKAAKGRGSMWELKSPPCDIKALKDGADATNISARLSWGMLMLWVLILMTSTGAVVSNGSTLCHGSDN